MIKILIIIWKKLMIKILKIQAFFHILNKIYQMIILPLKLIIIRWKTDHKFLININLKQFQYNKLEKH